MQITGNLGQEIIQRVAKYTEFSINIMDLEGKIVASTNQSRLGEVHSGAMEVLISDENLVIDEERLTDYPGTKEGVNLPIKHNDRLAGVVGVSGKPEEIYKFTGLIRSAVEIVMERLHIERQGYFKERQWSYWIHQLLHPSGFDKENLEEEAKYSLQVNIHSDWKVIVLYGNQAVDDILDEIRREIKSINLDVLFTLPFAGYEIIIALPASFERIQVFACALFNLTNNQCKIGIGEKGFGLKGIRNSYMQAKQALFFANKDSEISNISDWKWERLIAAIDEEEYKSVSSEFEQSLERLDDMYIETIDTFFNMNLSIKKTAEFLHVHRNTLLYRFDQIHYKVGLDPRTFHEACILRIVRNRQICANIQSK